MCWHKRGLSKLGITVIGILSLLVFMIWIPFSAVDARESTSQPLMSIAVVQTVPTEDATVAALNKEKLLQEVQQLQEQNNPNLFVWLRTNGAILLSTLVVVIGGLIGFFRWLADRRGEREKRAEERFQAVVTGLGDENEGAKIGAAILLRTFLGPGYEQFYRQTFDLAVAHLRLLRNTQPSATPSAPLPPTTLNQALIAIFKESFPLVRDQEKKASAALDATGIQLDRTYLVAADLQYAWMPQASLQGANLELAKLHEAVLNEAWLDEADLSGADLSGAWLTNANLNKANLKWADLSEARLRGAKLIGANLSKANLSNIRLLEANLSKADLSEANLKGADLRETHLEEALSLKNTDLRGVTGLTKEQLEICKAKGAIFDEDSSRQEKVL